MKSIKSLFVIAVAGIIATAAAYAAQNRVHAAGTINWTNPGAAVSSGDLIKIGEQYAIALTDIASNELGAVAVEGVWNLAIATNSAATFGTKLYYSDADTVTTTASQGTYVGVAVETITVDSTSIRVYLNAHVNALIGTTGSAGTNTVAAAGLPVRVNGTNYIIRLFSN